MVFSSLISLAYLLGNCDTWSVGVTGGNSMSFPFLYELIPFYIPGVSWGISSMLLFDDIRPMKISLNHKSITNAAD